MAPQRLRADAQRNLERLCAAATEVFAEQGLDAPLEEIARRAGVSIGTVYNRFGSREGLLDSVVAKIAEEKLEGAIAAVEGSTARDRFTSYVLALGETQAADPAFNDVVARRYPDAAALRAICDRAVAHGEELLRDAQAEGMVRADVTADDLDRLIWLNAQAIRLGGDWWRRALGVFLDGLRPG